jgi:protein-S-isoprenylcysteine O-methyltransferase Ste14
MSSLKSILKPTVWLFYLVIVFEILFMISPFALHFYTAYGPVLNVLHRWPATAWLTQFFLPHISQTSNPLLNALPALAGLLIVAGLGLFLAGAIPIYWAKFRRRGVVTGGVYRLIRHPQYVGLAVMGLGTVLIWPRFLVLITYVTMLFLYAALARWEEERCLARFGESYRIYQERIGRFLPQVLSKRFPKILPAAGGKRVFAAIGLYIVLLTASIGLGFALRDYALSTLSTFYMQDVAVLSPALLTAQELRAAYDTAIADARVQEALGAAGPGQLIIYVVPLNWHLPDLPIGTHPRPGGHYTPADFDRRYYKLLFTRARTYAAQATGRDIVKTAYGRDPIVLAQVDITAAEVTRIDTPPPHVIWGDIPTPMF